MITEGKTKTLTKLSTEQAGAIWQAEEPPYAHLINIETKNRLTANDAAIDKTANVAHYKTNQTCDIFRLLEQKEIQTAFISQRDDNNFIARECEMLPYECVTRRIAFGSFLKRNPNIQSGFEFDDLYSEFFYKLAVVPTSDKPEIIDESKARELYLRDGQWTQPVYTDPYIEFEHTVTNPSGYNLLLHDAKSVPDESKVLASVPSLLSPFDKEHILETMQKVFTVIEDAWKNFNVTLVDMKIEFGKCKSTGDILVADVIDNDSWRIWPEGDPNKQLDKQSFRDGENLDTVTAKYHTVSEYTKQFVK